MAIVTAHHNIVIVGGGSAGISVASRLQHKGFEDIGLIDPAQMHYYQPQWTFVGGGRAPAAESGRPQADLIQSKVSWIQESVTHVDRPTSTYPRFGQTVTYDHLVECPGVQLDIGKIPGDERSPRHPLGIHQ